MGCSYHDYCWIWWHDVWFNFIIFYLIFLFRNSVYVFLLTTFIKLFQLIKCFPTYPQPHLKENHPPTHSHQSHSFTFRFVELLFLFFIHNIMYITYIHMCTYIVILIWFSSISLPFVFLLLIALFLVTHTHSSTHFNRPSVECHQMNCPACVWKFPSCIWFDLILFVHVKHIRLNCPHYFMFLFILYHCMICIVKHTLTRSITPCTRHLIKQLINSII